MGLAAAQSGSQCVISNHLMLTACHLGTLHTVTPTVTLPHPPSNRPNTAPSPHSYPYTAQLVPLDAPNTVKTRHARMRTELSCMIARNRKTEGDAKPGEKPRLVQKRSVETQQEDSARDAASRFSKKTQREDSARSRTRPSEMTQRAADPEGAPRALRSGNPRPSQPESQDSAPGPLGSLQAPDSLETPGPHRAALHAVWASLTGQAQRATDPERTPRGAPGREGRGVPRASPLSSTVLPQGHVVRGEMSAAFTRAPRRASSRSIQGRRSESKVLRSWKAGLVAEADWLTREIGRGRGRERTEGEQNRNADFGVEKGEKKMGRGSEG